MYVRAYIPTYICAYVRACMRACVRTYIDVDFSHFSTSTLTIVVNRFRARVYARKKRASTIVLQQSYVRDVEFFEKLDVELFEFFDVEIERFL